MSEAKPVRERPMSPFMIGPYYKPQWTSMLSIVHRGMGVVLAIAGLGFAGWLYAVAAGPDCYQTLVGYAGGVLGQLVLAGLAFALVYHLLNGIRHLLWDIGWGFDLPHAFASGMAVVALAALGTVIVWYCAFVRGGA